MINMADLVSTWIEDNKQLIIDFRRWLHRHPELGFEERQTSSYLKETHKDICYSREYLQLLQQLKLQFEVYIYLKRN